MAKLKAAPVRVSWVRPEQLHFTLSFVGDVQDREIPQLLNAVNAAVRDLETFDLMCEGVGAFPSPDNPRTVWLGVTDGAERMVALHGAVEEALRPLGFRGEGRRYRPHLTLGRVRNTTDGAAELKTLLDHYADYEAGVMTVAEVTIFQSDLTSGGPQYFPLGHAELKG
ncbi:MAG: RNA 2',3'-cyclic phosphodiesterase [Pirellulales bacterium]